MRRRATPRLLADEKEACEAIGIPGVGALDAAPPADGVPALVFRNQARFHPLKYLSGLIDAICRLGGDIFADTAATEVNEEKGRVVARTANGHAITAEHAVVASNSPIHLRLGVHAKQAPYRSYALCGEVPSGSVEDALYWDTASPYHYVRLQPGTDMDTLIVGGEDHKTGTEDDWQQRFAALESWARDRFPGLGVLTHRWSGQVLEPFDGLAFIGRTPGSERIFFATGDSGQGITHGVLAGILLADLIATGESPWADIYAPERKRLRAAGTFVSENMTVARSFLEHLAPRGASPDDADCASGVLARPGLATVAAAKDSLGRLHEVSATCTHAGCIVRWNSFEHCWDCPCHGSHFAPDGQVLTVRPLRRFLLSRKTKPVDQAVAGLAASATPPGFAQHRTCPTGAADAAT